MPHLLQRFSSHTTTLAANTLYQLVGRFVSSVSTLVLTILLARMFGAAGYGDFVIVSTFVSFFYLFADFGLNAIYIRISAQHQGSDVSDGSWTTLLLLRISISVILSFLAGIFVLLVSYGAFRGYTESVRFGIVLLLPTIFFQAMITTANAFFQRQLSYKYSTIAVIVGSLVSLFALFIVYTRSLNSAVMFGVLPLLFGSSCTAVVSLFFVYRLGIRICVEKKLTAYKDMFLQALPLGLTLIYNVLYVHLDSIILVSIRGTHEVGTYGLAYKAFELLLVVPTFMMNAVYPTLAARVYNEQKREGSSLVRYVIKIAVLLGGASVVVLVFAWIFAPVLSVLKNDFSTSIPLFRILILGLPFFFLSSLTMWILISFGRQWTLVWIYAIAMVVNVVCNYLLTPAYGAYASAWITVICEGGVLLASGALVLQCLKGRKSS